MLKSKDKIKVSIIMMGIFLFLLSEGCITSSPDETEIEQIGKNIENAIEEEDIDLFMENISFDYSDSNGGTYDNHINNLPEDTFSRIDLIETLLDSVPGLQIVINVSIYDLIITEPYATGKMKINISLKLWGVVSFPGTDDENLEYSIDFIKEDDDWKIISLTEI
ncbi:hypothetical protein ES708_16946 [subsurface metagenome]